MGLFPKSRTFPGVDNNSAHDLVMMTMKLKLKKMFAKLRHSGNCRFHRAARKTLKSLPDQRKNKAPHGRPQNNTGSLLRGRQPHPYRLRTFTKLGPSPLRKLYEISVSQTAWPMSCVRFNRSNGSSCACVRIPEVCLLFHWFFPAPERPIVPTIHCS